MRQLGGNCWSGVYVAPIANHEGMHRVRPGGETELEASGEERRKFLGVGMDNQSAVLSPSQLQRRAENAI